MRAALKMGYKTYIGNEQIIKCMPKEPPGLAGMKVRRSDQLQAGMVEGEHKSSRGWRS